MIKVALGLVGIHEQKHMIFHNLKILETKDWAKKEILSLPALSVLFHFVLIIINVFHYGTVGFYDGRYM